MRKRRALHTTLIVSTVLSSVALSMSGCVRSSPSIPTATAPPPTPTPTPVPSVLTVCLQNEPDSLYPYGSDQPAAHHIWAAIYDGPLDQRTYATQPVILTRLPSLDGGDVSIRPVVVQSGDRVLAANGEVTILAPGTTVHNFNQQPVVFDGTPITLPQMTVTFTLQPDLHWSDGTPLTADDSVFSFAIAAQDETPAGPAAQKTIIQRTAGYYARDPQTVVWRALPGFLDPYYVRDFWLPLPAHAWNHLSASKLLTATISTHQPPGWGPFMLQEWIPGDHLTLVRNPYYFRASEGLPRLDQVIFRFIGDPTTLAQELLAGRCDLVPYEGDVAAASVQAALPELAGTGITAVTTYDARWELLAFGITPAAGYDRPDFFEDPRVRQAIALCIDRQAIATQVLGTEGRVLHGVLPPEHPLYGGDTLMAWGYAPAAGQALLTAAHWYDEDGDTVREAHAIPGIPDGTPFQVHYITTDDPLRVQVAQRIQSDLAQCGLQVHLETMPAEALFAPGPDGPLFGRRFDIAQFAWRAVADPLCDRFVSSQIPDDVDGARPNVTGFIDDEYDTACLTALKAWPDNETFVAAHLEAQRILSERLPVLPLFQRLKITLARDSFVGLAPDPTESSELWNIEYFDLRP